MFRRRIKAADQMGIDTGGSAMSRRRLFGTGAAMGVGMAAGATMGGPGAAQAAQGDPVLLGQDVSGATHRTGLFSTTGEVAVLNDPGNDGGAPGSVGVWGIGNNFGVFGNANTNSGGIGVYGQGDGSGTGIFAQGGSSGTGLAARGGTNASGVYGVGNGSAAGVLGLGDSAGVRGVAASSTGGTGVLGMGDGSGPGVSGTGGGSGTGVIGTGGSVGGIGVQGTGGGANGVGVSGTGNGTGAGVFANNTGSGPALSVVGPAVFNRSGVLTIAINKSSVTLSGISLGAASLVLATIQGNVAGIYVRGVTVVSGSSGSFTVHLNKATTKALNVGWFVVN